MLGCLRNTTHSVTVVLLAMLTLAMAGQISTASATTEPLGLSVDTDSITLVDRNRVGRTELDYIFTVNIVNSGDAILNVTAEVTSSQSGVTIIDGNLSFGDVGAGETVTSQDTFILRVGSRTRIDLAAISFINIQGEIPSDDDVIAPVLSITSPEPLSVVGEPTITVEGTIDDDTATVVVNGVAAVVSGNSFTAENVNLVEGRNTITAIGQDPAGNTGLASVDITLDTTAPVVSILAPSNGAILTATQVTVVGNVNDVATGTINADDVRVEVNGQEARVLNRSYEFPDLLLARGLNTIVVQVFDQVGNVGEAEIEVEVQDGLGQQQINIISGNNQVGEIGALLDDPLVVEVVDADGQALPDFPVTFSVVASDGFLEAFPQSGREVTVVTDELGRASAFYNLGTRSGAGNNMVAVTAPGFVGEVIFCLSSDPSIPARIVAVSGENQQGLGGQALPVPLQVLVNDNGGNPVAGATVNFTVVDGSGNIGGETTVARVTDTDGQAAVSFTPGLQSGINNNRVVATVDGLPNDLVVFISSSLAPEAGVPTTLVGVVVDNTDTPIPGATVQVLGDNDLGVDGFTDEEGRFELTGVPVGTVHLLVDGTTSSREETFTFLAFVLTIFPGVENVFPPISIPILNPDNAKVVGGDEDVVLTLEGIEGFEFTVFANSATFPDGSSTGLMSLDQVHADRVPMPPPDGTAPETVWTFQPAGVRFDPPVKVQLPNTQGLTAGQVVEILTFDHDLEEFVSVGLARVSDDGAVIVTDPGFGITKSGWGTPQPPPPPPNCTLNCNDTNECTSDSRQRNPCRCIHEPTNEGGNCGGQAGVNACREGVCQGGSCVGQNRTSGSCDDGLHCTINDQCQANGDCKGEKKPEQEETVAAFDLEALNRTIQNVQAWIRILELGAVELPRFPNVDLKADIKQAFPCCEQKGGIEQEKSTITGTLKLGTPFDTGDLFLKFPPYSGDFTREVFGRVIGVKYGVFIRFTIDVSVGADRVKDQCVDTICWTGFVSITGTGRGGLKGVVPDPLQAGDACNGNPCSLIEAEASLATGLVPSLRIGCQGVTGRLTHSGLKADLKLKFFEGTLIEIAHVVPLTIIAAGPVINDFTIVLPR